MKKFLIFIFTLVLTFSCASNPSGGGSASSTPLVDQNNPSQTLENTPDLKLKLKDMPDSLSDESLKLKSILKEALSMPVTNIPDVKGFAWFIMAELLQNSGNWHNTFAELKNLAKENQIPLNETITLYEDLQTGDFYKVKVTTDGGSGLRYYFTINMASYEMQIKFYIHIFPSGNSMAGEFVYEFDMGNGPIRLFAYFDGSTGNMENSFNTGGSAFFWKVNWVSSDSVNIIIGIEEDNKTRYIVANGNNNSGGVLFINQFTSERYYEYYNNKGGMVLQRYSDNSQQINISSIKYISLATPYSNYILTRTPTNTNYISTNEWVWNEITNSIEITNIYYQWWLETNNNDTYDVGTDIPVINITTNISYTWNTNYNQIVPVYVPMLYWLDSSPLTHFVFTETNLVNSVSNTLENLYNQWSSTNILDYITNRQIPNPENFPQ